MSDYETVVLAGDVVSVRHGYKGLQEGLVVGSRFDYAGRRVIEVQLDGVAEVYDAWAPSVSVVRRSVYTRPVYTRPIVRRSIERRIYW